MSNIKKIIVWVGNGVGKVVRPKRTFTIQRTEKSDMSSWWTYLDDAAWLTAGSTAFDDFFGYSWVRLSTAWVETAVEPQSAGVLDITQLGTLTSGDNVMIKFPVRWIKMSKSWSVVTLSITDWLGRESEWYQYYAHCTWTLSNPWTPKDAFYLWAYKSSNNGSNVLKSWSGQSPEVNQTQATSCTRASANGTWYNILWYYQRQYVNALYMMKYGNPDSYTVVWKWYTWASAKTNTGGTNSQSSATYWTSSATDQMKLFWLEDRWGNLHEWIWWAYTNGSKNLYVKLSWFDGTLSWGENAGLIQNTSWNNLSSIVGDNKRLFWPNASVSNTSYNTYYCVDVNIAANCVARWGCSWAYGRGSWAFRFATNSSASTAATNIGTRIMYL